jgi:hypothetical protein
MMIKHVTLKLDVRFRARLDEKREPHSAGTIYVYDKSFFDYDRPVKSMKIEDNGHRLFNNGFGRRK